jgi:hypothetical protein
MISRTFIQERGVVIMKLRILFLIAILPAIGCVPTADDEQSPSGSAAGWTPSYDFECTTDCTDEVDCVGYDFRTTSSGLEGVLHNRCSYDVFFNRSYLDQSGSIFGFKRNGDTVYLGLPHLRFVGTSDEQVSLPAQESAEFEIGNGYMRVMYGYDDDGKCNMIPPDAPVEAQLILPMPRAEVDDTYFGYEDGYCAAWPDEAETIRSEKTWFIDRSAWY